MSEFVKPDQKTIIREPSNIVCKEDDRLRLLVVVYSAPVYYERRRIIRKTWGDALRKIPGKYPISCFDLISRSSLHMKIQITGGKITENLGFKSLVRKVKFFFSLFFSLSNSSDKSGYLLL